VYYLIVSMSFESRIALGPKRILWYMSLGFPHQRNGSRNKVVGTCRMYVSYHMQYLFETECTSHIICSICLKLNVRLISYAVFV
jgi:hypothetical protein